MAQNLLTLSAGGLVTEISTAYAPLASPTFTGTVTTNGAFYANAGYLYATGAPAAYFGSGLAGADIRLRGAAGNIRAINFQTASVQRWSLWADTVAESGANAGSAFKLTASDDAGAIIDTPISITRAAGTPITLSRPVSTGAVTATTVKVTSAGGYISSDNSTGITTTVTTASLVGKTITIKDGIITGFA